MPSKANIQCVLKLIKNDLRSSLNQKRLSNLSLFSMEYDVFVDVDLDTIIDDIEQNPRQVKLI